MSDNYRRSGVGSKKRGMSPSPPSIQDTIDVVSAHEWTESNTPSDFVDIQNYPEVTAIDRHLYSVEHAWKTDLKISDDARAILKAEALHAGLLED